MTPDVVARVAALGVAQRELLERRLAARSVPSPPLRRHPHDQGPAPASAGQRSQWFVHQLDPGAAAFNKTDAVRITGPLDVSALRAAITGFIDRHEVLRTVYRLVGGEPVQLVQPVPDEVLSIADCQPGPNGDLPARVRAAIAAESQWPFDLASDVMYRVALFRLGADDHVLTRTTHHIAFDKWSAAIANRELSELYAAILENRPPQLPVLELQYRDYARWQRDLLTADARRVHLDFFAAHLAGAPVVVDVPSDRTRPARPSTQGATLNGELEESVAELVRGFALRRSATPFMVLLAAYGTLLSRYTRQEQLLVGVPVAGRSRRPLEDLVGGFINTVVIRVDLRGGPTFSELVARIRRSALGAMAHQDLPFDQLVQEMAPERTGKTTPLFQVMFDYINTPDSALHLAGTEVRPIPVGTEGAVHDLTLYVHDRDQSLRTVWEYRTDLFDRSTIAGIAGAFTTLVSAALSAPDTPVRALPLLSPANLQKVRAIGTGGAVDTGNAFVVAMVGRSALARPDAIAVAADAGDVTYAALWGRALALAGHLQELGVEPANRVAVVAGHTPHLVTAVVGVLAAGCTAVLLDHAQPTSRLRRMLAASDVRAVVGAGPVPEGATGGTVPVVDLTASGSLGGATLVGGVPALSSGDPAYVVFTSGSTGTPKGVVVGHGSLANFVIDAVNRYELGPSDRVLQFAAPGFDTVIEEILPTLVAGGTVVMRPSDLFPTFDAFGRFANERGVTVLDLPTAWWHAWVDEMAEHGSTPPNAVRLVIVGGEAASAAKWRTWRQLVPDAIRWVNTYGPSEATVVAAAFEPPPAWQGPSGAAMPIGYPIANTSFRVVDVAGAELGPRLAGELVIVGDSVALGYLDGVDAREAFYTDPEGKPAYRTGDHVRMLPDGRFEYLGRIDGQVKIRGTRVEPAEVEAVLKRHHTVRDAVVVAVRNGRSPALAAHVVWRDGAAESQLRDHAMTHLPAPMVPSAWHSHPALPTTPSGKIDRRLIATLAPPATVMPKTASPVMSGTEERLAALWRAVLDCSDVGLDDTFFDLGGHSLLGVRLISRVSDEFGVELPLRTIFDAGTVAAMAHLLDCARQRA